jgi:hypothetical protein
MRRTQYLVFFVSDSAASNVLVMILYSTSFSWTVLVSKSTAIPDDNQLNSTHEMLRASPCNSFSISFCRYA